MRGWVWFCWFVTAGCACIGLLNMGTAYAAQSAPQQAAGAALACGWVIIPYVFTKAMEGLRSLYSETAAPSPEKVPRPADLQR